MQDIVLKIRRRETPFYNRLYLWGRALRRFEVPVFRPVYRMFQGERALRHIVLSNLFRIFYHTPLFKLRCGSVGKGLYLIGGQPLVMGHLKINLGDNVTLHGKSTLVGAKVFDSPTLHVGDNTCLGYNLIVDVGCDITIGNNVFVGDRVSILSYDGHPTAPSQRGLPAAPETSKPITIKDNVWISSNCVILKGVTIGEDSVIANGAVVTSKIPARSLAIGNPARCFPLSL
ncbi:DapH/DapD/GlmU-related protein [Geomesophilobacter sediminis]|uniref:Acyltransferase n=1 Tax=Geomesophilobacter sediminis TaxID=2798584 RepID=A0A8J7M1T0_9BACT|nr:DapH/DapD/GlmU-related protein [Geomesophilobacter sediminis]MBJ6727100.1 hypothetical protein [Geomesophilobacter sediminis]